MRASIASTAWLSGGCVAAAVSIGLAATTDPAHLLGLPCAALSLAHGIQLKLRPGRR